MSQLQQHDAADLVPIDSLPVPGAMVKHVHDSKSFGMIVAKVGDQAEVLWTREPLVVRIQTLPIQANARKLRATWSVVESDRMIVGGEESFFGRSSSAPIFEGVEEYFYGDCSPAQIEEFQREGNVTYLQDGRIEVKRKSTTLPDYVDPTDVRVVRRRW